MTKTKKRLQLTGDTLRTLATAELGAIRGGADEPNIKTLRTACFGACASNPCV